jgi:hypothetical protein
VAKWVFKSDLKIDSWLGFDDREKIGIYSEE